MTGRHAPRPVRPAPLSSSQPTDRSRSRPGGRSIPRRTVFLLLRVVLLALVLALIFPEYVARQAVLFVLRRNGYPNAQLDVVALRPNRLLIEQFRLGHEPDHPQLEQLVLRYTWQGLLRRQIESAMLVRPRITIVQQERQWVVVGLADSPPEAAPPAFAAAWRLASLSVEGGVGIVSISAWRAGGSTLSSLEVLFSAELRQESEGVWGGLIHARIPAWTLDAQAEGTMSVGEQPWGPIQYRMHVADLRAPAAAITPWLAITMMGDLQPVGNLEIEGRIDSSTVTGGGTLHLKWRKGGISSSSLPLEVEGLEAQAQLRSVNPLLTEGDGVLSIRRLGLGVVQLDNGTIRFRMDHPDAVHVINAKAGFCGGVMWAESFSVPISDPQFEAEVRLDGIDLACLFALQTALSGSAEGTVGGRLRVGFHPGQLPTVTGHIETAPGDTGRLRMDDATPLLTHVRETDRRLREIEQSLRDFTSTALRAEIQADTTNSAWASVRLQGRSTQDRSAPPLHLNVNLEIDSSDLRYLVDTWRKPSP